MKKFKSLVAAGLLSVGTPGPLVIVGVTALTLSACKTSTLTTNLQTYTDLKNQVAAARIEWADFVVQQKTAAGTISDRSQQSLAIQAILAKQAIVNGALQVWFDRNDAFKTAQIAAVQTLPAPADVLDAGHAYLAAVKANKL